MKEKTAKILDIWHQHFRDEARQYSEFEPSDIEYFVGCLLYNHFAFTKALPTMKTMDLSYDFLSECGEEYDEIQEIIQTIVFDDELKKLEFLREFIKDAKGKYTPSELYILNRLEYHVEAMAERYYKGVEVEHIDFENPLLRK